MSFDFDGVFVGYFRDHAVELVAAAHAVDQAVAADPGDRVEEQKRTGWEMAVRIEKIIATVLDEAHKRQVEEVIETLSDGPEKFYRSYLD